MLGTTPSCLCTASRIGFDASGTSLRAGTVRRDMEISFRLHAIIGAHQSKVHHSIKLHNTVILEVILPIIGKDNGPVRGHDDTADGGGERQPLGCWSFARGPGADAQPQ